MVQAAVSIRAVTAVAAFAASYGVRREEILEDAGAVLDRQAEAELRRVQEAGDEATGVVGRARGAVLALLRDSDGEPTLDQAATRLRMSSRSLQRHLGAEGQSFRGVLDEVRRELALRHLGERQLATSEIAFLLGFSEVSAFHRAFRRWTGSTPSAYRRR